MDNVKDTQVCEPRQYRMFVGVWAVDCVPTPNHTERLVASMPPQLDVLPITQDAEVCESLEEKRAPSLTHLCAHKQRVI